MATKKAIKSIKSHFEDKNPQAANYEATQLLKSLNGAEPEVAQVLCYRGLALTHLDKYDEAEKCYKHAYRLQRHPLAITALQKLYEKQGDWIKYGRFLQTLVQDYYDANEAEKCIGALQDLLVLQEQHGPPEGLYATLQLLKPSSPFVVFFQGIEPPANTYIPFHPASYPPPSPPELPSLIRPLPHALHLLSSLALVIHLLIRQEAVIYSKIEADVKSARMKIGAKSEKETRRDVEAAVLGGSLGNGLVELLKEVGSHPGVEESVRREVEVREFDFWRKLVGVLPDVKEASKVTASAKAKGKQPAGDDATISELPPIPLFDPPQTTKPTKSDALARAQALADGFVLLQLGGPAEPAYQFILDGKDQPDIYYPLDFLHQYAGLFPESPLTAFVDDYCRWFRLPLPQPDEDEDGGPGGAVSADAETKESEKPKKEKKPKWYRKKGTNAKERRRLRRVAGQHGTLAEDVEGEEREELVGSMTKLLDKLPKSVFAHRVLARISVQEEDWANAVAYAEKARNLLKEVETDRGVRLASVKASLDTALAVALVPYFPPKHHTRAARLLNTVLGVDPTNTEARFARGQIFQYAGNWPEARKSFKQIIETPTEGHNSKEEEARRVAAREELGWCLVNEGDLQGGRDILEDIVQERDKKWEEGGMKDGEDAVIRARAWWRLGRTEWLIGDDEAKQNAEEWFNASIRASPTFAPAFSSLGLLYESASPPDNERAIKCFQKAFELDATEAEAAEKLAKGCADEDEWAQVRIIAMRVMEGEGGVEGVKGGEVMSGKERFAPKNGWAWKALGATEMYYRNYAKAAQALQIALRATPDASTYLLLSESYVKCGRHVAALKTLDKVLELEPGNWMARYDVGDIHYQLGDFEKATEVFEALTSEKPEDVGCLGGLAQAYLAQGQRALAGGFRQRARAAFTRAVQVAEKVLKLDRTWRVWGWKLVGDAAFELGGLSGAEDDEDETALRSVMEWLAQDDDDKRSAVQGLGHPGALLSSTTTLEHFAARAAAFAFSYRSYLLRDERPHVTMSALYDLATALHALAQRTKDEKQRRDLIKSAIGAIRLALEKDAGDERLWNALAVLCKDGGEQVAQHAFVTSLELYQKDPITWTNLGFLYLRLDDRELANQCFLKAQVIDPDYPKAWLGQGLLAERNGDRDHARGVFAHAVTLSAGSLLEADLAAAALIFERYIAPGWHDTSELHQPAFALKRYIKQRPKDSAAVHLHGLICERLGLVDDAVLDFERAVHLFEEDFEASESAEVEQRYAIALANLGRTRLGARTYAGAHEAYTNCWEILTGSQDPRAAALRVQVRLGQALSMFWQDQDSLEAFQHALDEAETCGISGMKEEVAVLLARTLWSMGSDGQEMAKSTLMECLSGESPSLKVTSTLGAIALATADDDLLEAVTAELTAMPPHKRAEDRADIAGLVLSTTSILTGDIDEAIVALSTALQSDAWNVEIRSRLAKLYMCTGQPEDAANLLLMDMRDTEPGLTGLRGVARLMSADPDGFGEVQRSVRAMPGTEEPWKQLAWARGILAEASSASGVE